MLLRRISAHVRAENWFAVGVDLLVVVVGLFIGLQVDTWWEEQKEAQIEVVYLQEIREDFEANQANLQSETRKLENIIRAMIVLHEQSVLDAPSLSAVELNENFSEINDMPTFVVTNRAYINLTGSGDLKLIQNRKLKNAMANYYAAAELVSIVHATHEMDLVQSFQPYIIENLDFAAVKKDLVDDFPLGASNDEGRILEVLATREFRNTVVLKWVICTDLLDQFRGMLERTDEVLAMLE